MVDARRTSYLGFSGDSSVNLVYLVYLVNQVYQWAYRRSRLGWLTCKGPIDSPCRLRLLVCVVRQACRATGSRATRSILRLLEREN